MLSSEVFIDLNDPTKYEPRITLHSVFQGPKEDNDILKEEIQYFTRALRKAWQQVVFDKHNKKMAEKEYADYTEEEKDAEEAQMLEDCKFGWNFRNFYIDKPTKEDQNKSGKSDE